MKIGVDSDRAAKDAESIVAMRKKLDGVANRLDLSMANLVKHPELHKHLAMLGSMKTRTDGGNILTTLLKQLDIDEKYVKTADIQTSYFKALQQLTVDEIKSYLTYCIADNIWMASNRDMTEYNVANGTDYTLMDARDTLRGLMMYTYSHAYATRYVTPVLKAKWKGLSEEMRSVFKDRINNLNWMSSTTKGRAIEKLEAMEFNVLSPDYWIAEGLPSLDNCNSLVEDVQHAQQVCYNLSQYFVGKNVKDEGFNFVVAFVDELTAMTAANNLIMNSLFVFPAIVLPPVYDEKNSDATMYACAMVIAHEMTHGFDNDGCQYDKQGNYINWWTPSDKMAYLAKQQLLIDCYNKLEIMPNELPGVYANGTFTLGENIADLGGVEIAHQCYVAKIEQQGYTGNELIKQEKRFFQAYADLWKVRYEPDYAKLSLEEDEHSLCKERVNSVVMNCDRWYELYDVKSDDQLYLKPEKRSHIW